MAETLLGIVYVFVPLTTDFSVYPTNNALLIKFRLSFDAEILLISIDSAYKLVLNVQKRVCNVYMFQLSFQFAYHHWWLGMRLLPHSCHLHNTALPVLERLRRQDSLYLRSTVLFFLLPPHLFLWLLCQLSLFKRRLFSPQIFFFPLISRKEEGF